MIPAIQITSHIYMVGSGEIGLSEEHDAHVYLIDAGSCRWLLDSGTGIKPETLTANLERLSWDVQPITHLLLTHCHADHAGGAAYLQETYGLQIIAGNFTRERVIKDVDHNLALDLARAEGIYPADYVFNSPDKIVECHEGDLLQIGESRLIVLETPGHSADSICYLAEIGGERVLFCGDTLLADGRLTLLNTFDSDLSDYRRTVHKLARTHFDVLCPGHGLFLLNGGQRLAKQVDEKLSSSIYIPPVITP